MACFAGHDGVMRHRWVTVSDGWYYVMVCNQIATTGLHGTIEDGTNTQSGLAILAGLPRFAGLDDGVVQWKPKAMRQHLGICFGYRVAGRNLFSM